MKGTKNFKDKINLDVVANFTQKIVICILIKVFLIYKKALDYKA